MKIKRTFSIVVWLLLISIYTGAWAQCKNEYFDYKDGSFLELTSYNANGKVQGITALMYKEFRNSGNNTEATVQMEMKDKKGKTDYETEYAYHCENGTIKYDLTVMMASSMQGLKNMEITIESDNLEFPPNMKEGQSLKDASMVITTTNSPIPMKMEMKITNRKIAGKETVTTPAGTFECLKLTYDSHFTTMGAGKTSNHVVFIAKQVGTVKSEYYNSNGKLQGYDELTTIR